MIIRKSEREIEIMRKAGSIVAQTHALLAEKVTPGITTGELDKIAEEFILSKGGKPAFKGYQGFPSTLCVAVNEEVVHGFPGNRVLEEGDIIGMDLGVLIDGFYGDSAYTLAVGEISDQAQNLLKVTEESLHQGIEQALEGNRLSDISHAVQKYVEARGYSVVRRFVGHGVGRNLHEDPQIPNFGPAGRGPRLKEGMVLAIEPMINVGTHKVKILDDGWTVITADKELSAHFEHTVAITKDGPRILTLP
ncbi:methionine aminopeptidase type I [Orenia metallireducens]|uniref:Methionine aminopeptidase n=1 Tax=Orenia metallireducens TaxID=1413210 RepID=A0A285HG66_9FIRM|nr:type I methionyl aminopeptidase [Orenia metallireducens]PRX27486.1 methionine aminopeptidase type I [Orenia metallireducens]SNY34739.1 methionine aminopeptidase, type I [Orenia metallireducens]